MATDFSAEIYKNLLSQALNILKPEDGIALLFRFIHDHIPAHRIFCYNMERSQKIMHTFIDYTSTSYTNSAYSARISSVFPWQTLHDMCLDKENQTIVVRDTRDNPLVWEHIQSFPELCRSCLTMLLYTDVPQDRLHAMALISPETDAFTDEHVQFLASLRTPLQQLTRSFFLSNPEPLLLTADGPLPASSEALLRRCPGLEEVMRQVDVVAPTSSTVLIQGPTGAGKELVAETLHALSLRGSGPLIKVNCGAIPETLVDSEFFGFEKGAFTGAMTARQGYFEQAQGGSIYLDEIGELTPPSQIRLLRVLESQEIRRVGGERRISLNVRIIAATHRNLWDMVARGGFREDLCYRLHVFPIAVPPLNERRCDIPVLVEYFYKFYVRKFGLEPAPALTHAAVRRLTEQPWPGNVRQLRYAVERALLLSMATASGQVRFEEVESDPAGGRKKRTRVSPSPDMAEQIRRALERAGGRIQGKLGAAALLGIHPATLRSRMRALGIPLPRQNCSRNDGQAGAAPPPEDDE